MKIGFTGARSLRHGFLAVSVIALGSLSTTAVYNSEEHKLLADRGAGLINQRSAVLPAGTRFQTYSAAGAQEMYNIAKRLAVGFATNNPADYSDQTKKVQDNSYYTDRGYAQRAGNLNIHIPNSGELASRHLMLPGEWPLTEFTFGELVSLYGDYRRTVFCVDGGQCYLTNRDNPQYRFQIGTRDTWTTYFEYGDNCFPPVNLNCGWRPDKVTTSTYLRSIGSGLWPPYGSLGNEFGNTAYPEEELDAGWWGDEMIRIANVNDWHFSSAAVAWYVGMHRLALLSVDKARTDSRYWNQALHYEANALHSLTDLFAFGHVATNRDRTSYGIMYDKDLLNDLAYQWMSNVLVMGGGSRNPQRLDGKLQLTSTLPPIQDRPTSRADFMASNRGTWDFRAKTEHDYHDAFNASGATVMNLKHQEFTINGDARLRSTSANTQAIIIETVRASVQSLFDAYERGGPIEEIGRVGSGYFDALLNIPIFVKSHPEHYFDGQWTRYARAVDAITNAGVVPVDAGSCEMLYLDGDVSLPAPRTTPCTSPQAPTQADVVEELLSRNGSLGRADQAGLDADGNANGSYDVGDFLAWVRANNAHPGGKLLLQTRIGNGGRP